MDRELRRLERMVASGDSDYESPLYHRYVMLGELDNAFSMLIRGVTNLGSNKNRGCFPVHSFSWKDADLEEDGCTGIRSLTFTREHIVAVIGGHKTFAPDEEGLDDTAYMDALHETFVYALSDPFSPDGRCELNWTGDDWSASTENSVSIPWGPDLKSMVGKIVDQADSALRAFREAMIAAHKEFYSVIQH
jgi:hypothetical protein